MSIIATEANEYSARIPALQESVSRERFSLDRSNAELFDHLKNLYPYVFKSDDPRSYHIEQFAALAEELARRASA
jgi:hypothetical protein